MTNPFLCLNCENEFDGVIDLSGNDARFLGECKECNTCYNLTSDEYHDIILKKLYCGHKIKYVSGKWTYLCLNCERKILYFESENGGICSVTFYEKPPYPSRIDYNKPSPIKLLESTTYNFPDRRFLTKKDCPKSFFYVFDFKEYDYMFTK